MVAVALLLSFLASLPREGGVASWILAGGHRTSGSVAKHRLQRGLVVVQVAVSVVLLAGAGLMLRSFLTLYRIDVGIDTRSDIVMEQATADGFTTLSVTYRIVNLAAASFAIGFYRSEDAALDDGDEPVRMPRELISRGFAAEEFVLMLGANFSHKNRDLALRAHHRLRQAQHRSLRLLQHHPLHRRGSHGRRVRSRVRIQRASTPSRQVIFLPSSRERAR